MLRLLKLPSQVACILSSPNGKYVTSVFWYAGKCSLTVKDNADKLRTCRDLLAHQLHCCIFLSCSI